MCADHVIDWMVTSSAHSVLAGITYGQRGVVLFNPRLNLSEVSRRRGLWAKITTKKVSINKIFILLLLKNMILCCIIDNYQMFLVPIHS